MLQLRLHLHFKSVVYLGTFFAFPVEMLSLKTDRETALRRQTRRHSDINATCVDFRIQPHTDITMHKPCSNEHWAFKLRSICSMALLYIPTRSPYGTFTNPLLLFSVIVQCSIKTMMLNNFQGVNKTRISGKHSKTWLSIQEHHVCNTQFNQSELGKHGRLCALWMSQGSHPGIGMLHAGYTPDNEKRQNGVWGG